MDKIVLDNVTIHVFPTEFGKLFSLQEVAQKIFDQTPGSIVQEMRVARYLKYQVADEDTLADLDDAKIPVDGGANRSATMIPPETFISLLADKRRQELIQPLQLALLKFSSQEAAKAMAVGNYEGALPVTLDAINQAQALFHHRPVIQMFPLYLLAAQANLGLKRLKQSEDFLSLATHLSVQHADEATHVMLSQLNRLYGQLYVLKNMPQDALQSFAEDLYHCSVEYGPEDVRSALGYYNLAKMFQSLQDPEKCGPCAEQAIDVWYRSMCSVLLGEGKISDISRAKDISGGNLPMTHTQLAEVVAVMDDLKNMVQNLGGKVLSRLPQVLLTSAMLFVHIGHRQDALDRLMECRDLMQSGGSFLADIKPSTPVAGSGGGSGAGTPKVALNVVFGGLTAEDIVDRVDIIEARARAI